MMGKIIKVDFSGKGEKRKRPSDEVYQLKIVLAGSKPPVWRRVQVPGNVTLGRLHQIIQLCMGWSGNHMHHFVVGRESYAPPLVGDDWELTQVNDEAKVKLGDLKAKIKKSFLYEYDFGDSWQHVIAVEKVIAARETILKYPVLLDGGRACPPEDIGGIPGYEDFLAALRNPESEENAEVIEWYGSDYDPDRLDIVAINKLLKKLR
jgi:hypothetical protein